MGFLGCLSLAAPLAHPGAEARPLPPTLRSAPPGQVIPKTGRRELLPGPCLFPFMENCLVGPYVSAAFAVGSTDLSGTSSNSNTYPNIGGGRITVDTNSNHNVNTNSSSLVGADLNFGYDLGGLRAEVSYAYTAGSTNNFTISGTDSYSVRGFGAISTLAASGDASSVPLSRQSLLFNVAVDIPTGSRVIPYIGAGIGVAWLSLGSLNQQTSDLCAPVPGAGNCPAVLNSPAGSSSAMAYQAKAGIAYQINVRTSLFMEAVYDYTSATTVGNINLASFSQASGKWGVRYRF
jgi:opacity protein-like surface antigen